MISASMNFLSLKIGDALITSTDLIDLVHLGRHVPVYADGEEIGAAVIKGKLVHVTGKTRCVFSRKCLKALLAGDALSIRVQPMPDGVAL